ncbi:MAG TPA: YkgJ family cysteine cluster protein [Methanoregulaceae archaeon]|nr:YkgJ family cysteine cluster protein [Methanoregulaceae archaeon]
MPDISLPCRIIALIQERNRLFACSPGDLEAMIRGYGFRCTRCGRCCTRRINDHIFLLDRDVAVAREIDPQALEPAPGPEFCDPAGMLYVSGYAVRMKDDPAGSCWFLDGTRCRIYEQRFSVCRIYPYMHRPVHGAAGEVRWQQFARRGEHGEYDRGIPESEVQTLARGILEYEHAFLTQQIAFLETLHEYFSVQDLRHDREMYARQSRRYRRGELVDIMVYCEGELKKHRVTTPEKPMTPAWQCTGSS